MFRKLLSFVLGFLIFLEPGVFATDPLINLGIQKDFLAQNSLIQSYSSWITFHDNTKNDDGQYPPEYMSKEKLLKLTTLAYNEMLAIFDSLPLAASDRPSAMILLASGSHIFFASSMKGKFREFYAGGKYPAKVHPILAEGLANCQGISEKSHRTRLGCGEPNVIDLCFASGGAEFTTRPRATTWLTYTGIRGQEQNVGPCMKGASGYGCTEILAEFEIDPFWNVVADAGDGSEWAGKYDIEENPRTKCDS